MPADTKQKVFDAITELLFEKPSSEIRTREIAERAGVNIATLHYYYGSKDALVATALETATTAGIDAWIGEHLDFDHIREQHLIDYVRFMLLSSVEYEALARTRALNIIGGDTVNATQMLIYDTLHRLISGIRPELSADEQRIKATLLYSVALSLACSDRETSAFLEMDLMDPSAIDVYARRLVKAVL